MLFMLEQAIVGKCVLLLRCRSSVNLWCLLLAQLLAVACWTAGLKWLQREDVELVVPVRLAAEVPVVAVAVR